MNPARHDADDVHVKIAPHGRARGANMISTLGDLIAPLSEQEFAAILRARVPARRPCPGTNRFSGLMTWDALCEIVERERYFAQNLRVTLDGKNVLPILFAKDGKVVPERIASFDRQGASFIVNHLELFVPELRALGLDVGARLMADVEIGAISTTGRGGAIKLHYDDSDVLVLQLCGNKRWRIYGNPVAYPVPGLAEQKEPKGPPVFDEVLHEGDLLCVPSGYWHHCENGDGRSLHLGLMAHPFCGVRAVRSALRQVIEEEMFRMPLARFATVEERTAHEAALKARLLDIISQEDFFRRRTTASQDAPENLSGSDDTP
jgi:Cupin superfamily protein